VKKDPEVFLGHIVESIELIEEYSEKLTTTTFKKDQAMQDAIVRRLEIIGEAVKNIPTSFKANYPAIPWKQMAGMRDILIHEYFDIDLNLTWQVVKRELPLIKAKLQVLLSDDFK
jgi:uncharacterized protein with HEPN domain